MDQHALGGTGQNVSRLSFGASALGGVVRTIDEDEGIRAEHAALDAGINSIDVAPACGGTVAESVLGKALRDVPRDRYYLSTKAGKYTGPGGPVPDWHPAGAREREIFTRAAAYCEQQGTSLAKIAFQFSCHDSPFATTMFSSARTSSVARNLAWYDEPLDQELLAGVRRILEPVIDQQWDFFK